VKPANLFLAQTSTGQQIKVVDFGISKQLDVADDLTTTASTVGTPKYMAPEQMRSAKFADARGDIWSLGIVLYELTTGKCPFHGDSITALCFDVMERTPTAPSELNPALPHSFDDVIARCLEKNPDDRFQSMEALVTALRAVAPDSGRYSGLFNAAAMEPAAVSAMTPVSSVTPDPTGATKLHPHPDQARHMVQVANADPSFATRLARPNPDPTGPTRLHSQPDIVPPSAPRSQPGMPESAPIDLAPQETMQSWNTTSLAIPGAWKKEPNRPIAVWIAVAVGAFSLVGIVAVGLAWSHGSTPSVAASSAPLTETASPTAAPTGPVVKVVDVPAPSTTVSIPVSALPPVPKLTTAAPRTAPTPVDTSNVPTTTPTQEAAAPAPSSTPAPTQPGPAQAAPPPDCHKTHTCTVH
jgi:serine/threonine-protein kinase